MYLLTLDYVHSPYIVAELPANLLLRKIGPRILMPTILTLWGIMVTLQGTFLTSLRHTDQLIRSFRPCHQLRRSRNRKNVTWNG